MHAFFKHTASWTGNVGWAPDRFLRFFAKNAMGELKVFRPWSTLQICVDIRINAHVGSVFLPWEDKMFKSTWLKVEHVKRWLGFFIMDILYIIL